jgi:protein-tyrosine-phosphatase
MSCFLSISLRKPFRLIGAALLTLGAALLLMAPASAAEVFSGNTTIVFVCLHGSVKSQIAAAHFNRIAGERGLPYTAVSRGTKVDSSIPASVRNSLGMDGLAPMDTVPKQLTAAEADSAVSVIAFDSVPDDERGSADVNYWSDVPPATKDYAAARDVIVKHIDDLVPTLAARARPQETLRGVVTAVDERDDRITLRLASDVTTDVAVQDGLIFNSLHDGDRVEVQVENIGGVKTVVALRKE